MVKQYMIVTLRGDSLLALPGRFAHSSLERACEQIVVTAPPLGGNIMLITAIKPFTELVQRYFASLKATITPISDVTAYLKHVIGYCGCSTRPILLWENDKWQIVPKTAAQDEWLRQIRADRQLFEGMRALAAMAAVRAEIPICRDVPIVRKPKREREEDQKQDE